MEPFLWVRERTNGVPRAWMITGFMPVQACPADLNHDSVVDDD